MKRRKLVLALSVMAMVLAVVVLALTPTLAKAQGLVEYVLCAVFPNDTGTNIEDEEMIAFFEAEFDITWEPEYGVYSYCAPIFTGPNKAFSSLRSILIAYQDEDNTLGLTPGDTQVGVVRQSFRFPTSTTGSVYR